jgi:hypothetical protein
MFKKKIRRPKKVRYEPKEATKFQLLYISRSSGIRLCISANPRKCIGENVIFTPKNVIQNYFLPKNS